MVPTQFVRLLRLPAEVKNAHDVSSLNVVVHSAAPCPLEVKRQMMEWWGPVIWETYGGMEGAATIAKPHRWLEKPGTVGRAVRGMPSRSWTTMAWKSRPGCSATSISSRTCPPSSTWTTPR
jgi:long-chain acyl-CoA synthetase